MADSSVDSHANRVPCRVEQYLTHSEGQGLAICGRSTGRAICRRLLWVLWLSPELGTQLCSMQHGIDEPTVYKRRGPPAAC
ncbi:hypothetical protein LX36DRAFT_57738 [Colletotrichum falcatum]|nr:hypothetical protein LX36DRAFT_57738 [Colletotrichum falcatum]